MKVDMYVELDGNQTDFKELTEAAKNIWKAEGNKVKDLNNLQLYYKPQENKCYYVFNGTINGNFQA